ncbi:UDP-glucose 4-epimerase family protein [Rhodocyclus tenuis]|uniref:UDP-glucose 4-epimerase family protein n=1 Tax=Rhodocyclus tenuis TaxID=1066 RepID=UPI001903B76B|nr:SDR family oxidoreductase [Rhodocyclus tenuis]MBK1681848.1 nucleoside-diphosphate sugar epimerase [Rhodocyclus tenuis]
MKAVVTGASGFIGCQLCSTLASRGFEVVPIVRGGAVGGEVAVGNIGPVTDWQDAFSTQPEVVIHLAARVHVMKETATDSLEVFRQVNVLGTLNLAHQAVAAGVKRFIYLSSIKVNGEINTVDRPFRADDIPAPEDAYAISKTEAEKGLRDIARETGLEVVIVRPPLVYGPSVKGNFATLVRWVCRGVPLPLGSVSNLRSLVALDNLIDFIVLCADCDRSPRAANEVFLISDGEHVSTTELLRNVAWAYGVSPRLISVPAHLIKAVVSMLGKGAVADRLLGSLVVDSSKARALLGWTPVISMDEQLQKMAQHDSLA